MAKNDLSFEQGIAIGLLMATKFHDFKDKEIRNITGLDHAFQSGELFFNQMLDEYTGKRLTCYPEGIPREALEATDKIIEAMVIAGELD